MAVRYGYALIPFASVGMEDAVKVAFSVDVSWIARQLEKQNRGRLRVPFLYPYNSLERQVTFYFRLNSRFLCWTAVVSRACFSHRMSSRWL